MCTRLVCKQGAGVLARLATEAMLNRYQGRLSTIRLQRDVTVGTWQPCVGRKGAALKLLSKRR